MTEWAIGVDIGGTFTDVVALDYSAGKLHSLKVLTTHGDPAQGVTDGVSQLIKACSINPFDVRRVVHATTLFANALIERRRICTALLINQGFKDVIEIGHERKYDLYDLTIDRAPPLVPRNLRAEISGRLEANLVLGYLNPDYFAGGTLSITPQASFEGSALLPFIHLSKYKNNRQISFVCANQIRVLRLCVHVDGEYCHLAGSGRRNDQYRLWRHTRPNLAFSKIINAGFRKAGKVCISVHRSFVNRHLNRST